MIRRILLDTPLYGPYVSTKVPYRVRCTPYPNLSIRGLTRLAGVLTLYTKATLYTKLVCRMKRLILALNPGFS